MVTHEKIQAMRTSASYSKHNKNYWSKENDKDLKKMYYEGYGISEIAYEMGRTENSILKRIKDLKIEEKRYNTGKNKGKLKGCLCSECDMFQNKLCNGLVCDDVCLSAAEETSR